MALLQPGIVQAEKVKGAKTSARLDRQGGEGKKPKSPRLEMRGRGGGKEGLGGGCLAPLQRLGLTGCWEVKAQCPRTWRGLVSNFGNGHTRISNLAARLAAKGSE